MKKFSKKFLIYALVAVISFSSVAMTYQKAITAKATAIVPVIAELAPVIVALCASMGVYVSYNKILESSGSAGLAPKFSNVYKEQANAMFLALLSGMIPDPMDPDDDDDDDGEKETQEQKKKRIEKLLPATVEELVEAQTPTGASVTSIQLNPYLALLIPLVVSAFAKEYLGISEQSVTPNENLENVIASANVDFKYYFLLYYDDLHYFRLFYSDLPLIIYDQNNTITLERFTNRFSLHSDYGHYKVFDSNYSCTSTKYNFNPSVISKPFNFISNCSIFKTLQDALNYFKTLWTTPELQKKYEEEGLPDKYPEEVPDNGVIEVPTPDQLTELDTALDPEQNPELDPDKPPQELPDLFEQTKPKLDPSPDPSPNPDPDPNPDGGGGGGDSDGGNTDDGDSDPKDLKFDLKKIFPFCIPFDLVAILALLSADRETPYIDIPIKISILKIDEHIIIDFHDYENVGSVSRMLFLFLFCLGLMKMTQRVIKW